MIIYHLFLINKVNTQMMLFYTIAICLNLQFYVKYGIINIVLSTCSSTRMFILQTFWRGCINLQTYYGGKQMNMNLLEEANNNLNRTRNRGVDRRYLDNYAQMARQMSQVMQMMQEEQSKIRQIANMADDARDRNLAETFMQIASRMNNELQAADDCVRRMRSIANQ